MAETKVKGPDGKIITVQHPDGATEADIISFAQQQSGAAPAQPQQSAPPPDQVPGQPEAGYDQFNRKQVAPSGELGWGDVITQAVANTPASGHQALKDLVAPFMSPIETAKSLGNLALGTAQKLIPGEQSSEKYADAVGNFVAQRYGGMEEFKRTLAKDPVGVLADASTLLSGGGALAARAPGMVSKAARMSQRTAPIARAADAVAPAMKYAGGKMTRAGQLADPVNLAAKGVKWAGKAPAEIVASSVGMMTGTGGDTMREALLAGRAGGKRSKDFTDNMRGKVDLKDVLGDVDKSLSIMHQQRANAYNNRMKGVKSDPTVLDFSKVDDALREISDIGVYKGKSISPNTDVMYQKLMDHVDEWRQADPSDFHTPEGLDALKKKIGDELAAADFTKPEYKMAKNVYDAIKEQIVKQAPEYGEIMKEYAKASDEILDIRSTLSTTGKASADTRLRKLQSALANNVNASFGARKSAVDKLDAVGDGSIVPKISGQALNSWTPRGLQRGIGGAGLAYGLGQSLMSGFSSIPAFLAGLPLQSPRLMGEIAHAAGQVSRPLQGPTKLAASLLNKAPTGARMSALQMGRLVEELQKLENR